jgi:hypothetical protein
MISTLPFVWDDAKRNAALSLATTTAKRNLEPSIK